MTASSKTVPKTSPHSRFIPREEIDAVSAWRFSAVDGSDELPPPAETEPEPEPNLLLEQAVAEARQQSFADGFAHGHDAGGKEVRDALEAAMRRSTEETGVRMGQLLHNMTDQLIGCEQKIARQILDLACDIARQVVRQELQSNTGHLRAVIGESLELIVEDGLPATVRMHPNDLSLMKDALMDTLGENAPEFVADVTITPGGCLVQTPSAIVDATVEKRWSRAVGNLGLDTPWDAEEDDE
ncbi:FliH/SctL family protein [Hydrogenophaga sp. MI9]|uniref:FliH/SctL family protein n=1 Tax=Hydrogenophaga sp. MI9 TaxID=3453719 RepID=UPI003EE968C9